jgi:hypothetical protein
MKKFLVLTIFFIPLILFAEKWVGRATITNKIDGTKTVSGEIYKSDSLTAACNGFKIGAEVVVINVKTKKAVTITINDRLPNNSNYFIVLSMQAAKEIGLENESGLVVVEADFSDVNSTERLNVNGLVKEGEIDEEFLKNFPTANWPLLDNKDLTKIDESLDINNSDKEKQDPGLDKEKMMPDKKTKVNKGDHDNDKFYAFKETERIYPEEEENLEPKMIKKESRMNNDLEDFKGKPIKEGQVTTTTNNPQLEEIKSPQKKLKEYAMDSDNDIFGERKTMEFVEKTNLPEEEKEIEKPNKKSKINKIDMDQNDVKKETKETIKIEKKKTFKWVKNLEKNKIYVRFSTTFDKNEGERRLELFNEVFPDVVGLEKDGKYILFIGPIDEKDVDKVIKGIRRYGYKDSYVVKG